MPELQQELDCYGLLQDDNLTPCRDKCAVRFLCREELKKRFDKMGREAFKQKQQEAIMANENEMRKESAEKSEKKATMDPQVSPLVSEVIATFTSLGLKTIQNRGYVAFKIDNRNIFSINKMKANKLPNIIKFVFTKVREEFPKEIEKYVSKESIGGFFCANVETVEELSDLTKKYLEIFKG
jgi:hypothetical protein